QDPGARRDRVRPLDVERDLERPTGVLAWIGAAAALVDLRETAVCGYAGREAELGAEDVEVALGRRVVIGVDDCDRLAGARRGGGREVVDRLDRRGRQARRRRARVRIA